MCDVSAFVLAATAARHLEKSSATVRNYADTNQLNCVRTLDGVRLFRLADVLALKAQLAARRETDHSEPTPEPVEVA